MTIFDPARVWRKQPGNYFFISTKEGEKWKDKAFKRSEFGDVLSFVEEANESADVYFCPHGFKQPYRRKQFAVDSFLLWSDLDTVDPREIGIEPTIAWQTSPDKYAALWSTDDLTNEAINKRLTYWLVDQFKLTGKQKSDMIGGWDYSQVLRVPGSYHVTKGKPGKLLWSDGNSHRLKTLERKLPALVNGHTEIKHDDSVYSQWEDKLKASTRRLLMRKPTGTDDRSRILHKLQRDMLEAGLPSGDVLSILSGSHWNKFRSRANNGKDQLKKELNKARAEHFKKESDVDEDLMFPGRYLSDIKKQNIEWVWYPYLARGELTVLEGDPEARKSFLSQAIGKALADGTYLPSPRKREDRTRQLVFYFDSENSPEKVLANRLGDVSPEGKRHIKIEDKELELDDEDHLDQLRRTIEIHKPAVVVFDVFNDYLGAVDPNKTVEVRRVLRHLKYIANETNCAMMVVRHLSKGNTGDKMIYRGAGSMAIGGTARIVISVGKSQDEPGLSAFGQAKNNLAPKPKVHTFGTRTVWDKNNPDAVEFFWGDYVDEDPEKILDGKPAQASKLEDAVKLISLAFDQDEEVDVRKIERMAEAQQISMRTVQRAAADMHVTIERRGHGKDHTSVWRLADDKGRANRTSNKSSVRRGESVGSNRSLLRGKHRKNQRGTTKRVIRIPYRPHVSGA